MTKKINPNLTAEQKLILFEEGTERAGSSELNHEKREGSFHCANCDEKLFLKIVKLSFQQRRKTIRNSLKQINLSDNLREDIIFDKRPEQLSVNEFIDLTNLVSHDLNN